VFVVAWPQSDPGALLPTPVVNDMGAAYTPDEWDEWTTRLKASHGNGNGHGASLSIETLRLLKPPTAQLAVNGGSQHPDKRAAGGHGPTLADEIEHLLPTPRATDGTKGGPNQRGSSGDLMLPSAVLLPTPTSTDHKASGSAAYAKTDTHTPGTTLTDATVRQSADFGQYAPAIARWEALTRPAPPPTEPTGKGGAHRLSPRFVEFMQGLPAGHVTDPAIWHGWKPSAARNAQLKALGNGVVPQQAATAIRHLLGVRERYTTMGAGSNGSRPRWATRTVL
jgi:DNA (cytosine-5)-methyltransferase 1